MKPINQMTLVELRQYAAWEQWRWSRIVENLNAMEPALTQTEKTARQTAARQAYTETFDDYLASLPPA